MASMSLDNSSSSRTQCSAYLEVDQGSGYSMILGTNCFFYSRNASEGKCSAVINSTLHIDKDIKDTVKFRIRVKRDSGNGIISTVANASSFIGIQDI
jgi:hypothetical protein